MARRMLRRAEGADDRRAYNRLAIEREVRYKVYGVKKTIKTVGTGKTIDMSSGGLLISTESALAEGDRVELAVSWPAQLNDAIPLKLVAFGTCVNLTVGLPIIRTSVDHGTAFDIVGKGIADPGSLVEAITLAAKLAKRR